LHNPSTHPHEENGHQLNAQIIPVRCGGDLLPLGALEPFQGELKSLDKKSYKKLRANLELYGIRFPVFIWRHEGHVYTIDGHQRALVLKDMISDGWILADGAIPVVEIEADSEAEAKQLILLATSQYGRTNPDALYEFLHAAEIDFQQIKAYLDVPGINLERFEAGYYTPDVDEDEAVTLPAEPVLEEGDLVELGEHRLIVGDSRDPSVFNRLLAGGHADVIFTDPPYNVNYSGQGARTSTTIANDNLLENDFRNLLGDAFSNLAFFSKSDAPLYCCYASRTHREFEDALNAAGWFVKNQIIWVKFVASMGWSDYRWKHEPILYCSKQQQRVPFYGDRAQYTEWTEEMTDAEIIRMVRNMSTKENEDGSSTVWRLHREAVYDHPTQKPVKLMHLALKNSSKKGQLVLDPFSGAGSTLIAAEQMGRRAAAIEIDPRFADATVTRWTRLVGQPTVRINGEAKLWTAPLEVTV
jgi:DNA modification methylase